MEAVVLEMQKEDPKCLNANHISETNVYQIAYGDFFYFNI